MDAKCSGNIGRYLNVSCNLEGLGRRCSHNYSYCQLLCTRNYSNCFKIEATKGIFLMRYLSDFLRFNTSTQLHFNLLKRKFLFYFSLLQHSCMPNVFVQNVFVDTHDLRFPWVSSPLYHKFAQHWSKIFVLSPGETRRVSVTCSSEAAYNFLIMGH